MFWPTQKCKFNIHYLCFVLYWEKYQSISLLNVLWIWMILFVLYVSICILLDLTLRWTDWVPGRFWQAGSCWWTDSGDPPLSQHTPTSHHPFPQSAHVSLEEKHNNVKILSPTPGIHTHKIHTRWQHQTGRLWALHSQHSMLSWSRELSCQRWYCSAAWEVRWGQRLGIRVRYK